MKNVRGRTLKGKVCSESCVEFVTVTGKKASKEGIAGLLADETAAMPDWITDALIEDTRRTWQPFSPAPLTTQDAVAMLIVVCQLLDAIGVGREGCE